MGPVSAITAAQRLTRAVTAAATTAQRVTATNAVDRLTLSAPQAAVTYTDRIKKSGSLRIDALLAGGNRWFHESGASGEVPSAVSKKTITYSFLASASGLPTQDANGFEPLSDAQKSRVRDALAYYASIIDVSFQEVASGGDLSYGANVQNASAGYARYPNEGSQVMLAKNDASFSDGWGDGTYGWQVLLHETGHALGLKHPGNYNAGGGGTPGPYLPGNLDNRNNTIMSYHNGGNMRRVVADGGQLRREQVNASTLQGLDMEALQYLYGAAQGTSARSYAWDTDAVISQTVWNPNDGSAIDMSNQTKNNLVDLRAGRWSSIAMRDAYADTGYTAAQYGTLRAGDGRKVADILGKPSYTGRNNLFIAKGSRFTEATGGSGNDTVIANNLGNTVSGGGGDDRVFWTGGNLTVSGGDGSDTVFVRNVAGARWTLSDDKSTLTLARRSDGSTLGSVALSGVEAVRVWDGTSLKAVGKAIYIAA